MYGDGDDWSSFSENGYLLSSFRCYDDARSYLAYRWLTIRREIVQVDGRLGARLSSSDPMSLHTDHPAVVGIAWYCEQQSDEGGDSVLLDFSGAVTQLNRSTLATLAKVKVAVPAVLPAFRQLHCPLLSESGIYYAKWLVAPGADDEAAALAELECIIESASPIKLRLAPGNLLVIDNKRMLHGRSGIVEKASKRQMIRHWMVPR